MLVFPYYFSSFFLSSFLLSFFLRCLDQNVQECEKTRKRSKLSIFCFRQKWLLNTLKNNYKNVYVVIFHTYGDIAARSKTAYMDFRKMCLCSGCCQFEFSKIDQTVDSTFASISLTFDFAIERQFDKIKRI